MQNPLVSIIIPLYNAENYIKETIQCLHKQTHSNIEIIVVDDHSMKSSFSSIVKSIIALRF
jgi:glycosyltransferase involved in cell wall biosynthesis